ncbi:tetraacyldisaccharide 4'-kinase [Rhodoplanes sp. Z2-YC6860]|uniref:tetraacyldisaccharide 4'-kinase n=1 Tax=Rhodoplanes sp. Z2-YC6860 TaxID=674703 RepID=UPI00078C611C|nr:tetraacyldisaccharide 4'-kinase [Rhodoplanes sp. Z2-YC6860]AMN39973.1 tetraacyldisaccharide 4'-kinase [Rhodoplanes sp. Z2-YC6860]
MRDPAFWWRPAGLAAGLLAPLGAIYGAVAGARMAKPGRGAGVPVVCVGNLTLGGAGKTPAAILVAQILTEAGRKAFVLSRGYGGTLAGPVRVEPERHRAAEVGDEPLLLARMAPTIVARDRGAGAEAARAAGAAAIVMDDGFQSPNLHKDISILVVDGRRGIGNARVFPAGPLRAPLYAQLQRAGAVLVIGQGTAGDAAGRLALARGLPVFHGRLEPDGETLSALRSKPVLAFAGIGDPEKFFATLADAGLDVRARVSFPDHHRFSREEADSLVRRATREGLVPLTTEKDMARLSGDPGATVLAGTAEVLPVRLVVTEQSEFRDLILRAVGA